MKFLKITSSMKRDLLAQAKQENPDKPENIIEKMIIGRLNKEMKEDLSVRPGIRYRTDENLTVS